MAANYTRLDLRQTIERDTLQMATGAAGSLGDAVARGLDKEVTRPYYFTVTGTSRVLSVAGAGRIVNAESQVTHVNASTIGINDPLAATFNITFPAASGGSATSTLTIDSGATLTVSSNNYINVGINLSAAGNLALTYGTQNASASSAGAPAVPAGYLGIGYVQLFNNAGTIANITNGFLFHYDSIRFGQYLTLAKSVSVSSNVSLTDNAVHFVDTSAARSLTMPAPSKSSTILVIDSTGGAASNNISILQNASEKINGVAATYKLSLGYGSWEFTSDGTDWYLVGSAAASSGGAGEKNYILNPSDAGAGNLGANNTLQWLASGAGVTVATDVVAADLPRAQTSKSGILISRVSGSTAYAYYRFTLDAADYNKKLKIKFDMKPGSSYVSSDFRVDMYSNTAAAYNGTSTRLALSTDSSAVTALVNQTGQFQCAFDAPGSTAPYLELRVGLNASTASTALAISDAVVGPGIQPQGAVISEWLSYTPTISAGFGTTSAVSFLYRRVGSQMEVRGTFTSGTIAASLGSISLPTGFTLPASSLNNTTAAPGPAVGTLITQSSLEYQVLVTATGTSTSNVYMADYYSHTGGTPLTPINASVALSNNRITSVNFTVPVNEWAGSGTVNVVQNDVEYAYNTSGLTTANSSNTTAFGYGPTGALIGSIAQQISGNATTSMRVRFQTPISATSRIDIETDYGTLGAYWGPFNANSIQPLIAQGPATMGVGMEVVNSTDVDIYFGNGGRLSNNATYSNGGATYAGVSGWRWRIKKSQGGQAVGFSDASGTTKGLITSYAPTVQSGVKTVSSANYAILTNDGYATILVSTGASNRTITLPSPASSTGRVITIKKTDSGAGAVVINAFAAETIDGAVATNLQAQNSYIALETDGTNWFVKSVADSAMSGPIGAGVTVTNTAFSALGSVSLGSGTWIVSLMANYSGSSGNSYFDIALNTTSGSNSGNTLGLDWGRGYVNSANGVGATIGMNRQVTVSTATTITYYLNAETSTGSGGSGGIIGSLVAQRIR